MTTTTQDPIHQEWTIRSYDHASAVDVASRLGRYEVSEIPAHITPFLAAAGAELASVAGISWRFRDDDPVVALMRLVSKAALIAPDAAGPHAERLVEQLDML